MSGYPPDFVICGIPTTDGVCVLASTELTQAELITEMETIESWSDPRPIRVGYRHTLNADMRSFVTVYEPDYATAFRTLFNQWTPHTHTTPQQSLGGTKELRQ